MTSNAPRTCRRCDAPVPAGSRGRPSTFCSQTCRRLTAEEVRSVRRAVDRATAELAEARADAAGLGGTFAKTLTAGRRITYWQTQLTEATERLRALQGGRHTVSLSGHEVAPRGA